MPLCENRVVFLKDFGNKTSTSGSSAKITPKYM